MWEVGRSGNKGVPKTSRDNLGETTARLVEELTPYRAHFAPNQSSLEGVTNHILRALSESVGLIAILHPRGQVERADGTKIDRASVWVEQEIAIAAFMNQVLQRGIKVRAYTHESIGREGLREQLLLNPKVFSQDQQVLDDLREILPHWAAEISVQAQPRSIAEEMAELASSGRQILVTPALPASKSAFDSYVVVEVNDKTVRLKNTSSNQPVTVPLGRLIEILWRGDDDKPELNVNGRLQWVTLQGEWKFFPDRPEERDAKEFGFGKPTSPSDRVVNEVCRELQSRGYQLARFSPQQLRMRRNHGWEVVYDVDGRYFQYQGPDKRILAAWHG
jgi:hypothetical protein